MDNSNTGQTCDEVVICLFLHVNANHPDNCLDNCGHLFAVRTLIALLRKMLM